MERDWDLPRFETEVKEIIEKRNEKLVEHFTKGKYEKMPKEFKFNGKIVTHDGEIIEGWNSENYWRKVGKDLNGTDLKFKIKMPYFKAIELTVSEEPGDEEINFVAFEITEFSFMANGEKECIGYIDPTYRHRVRCDIDP